LKTLGRRYGLAVDILDAMTGHGRKTVADTYGDFPSGAMQRELSKIPILALWRLGVPFIGSRGFDDINGLAR
jgi:hypothetical protein